MNTPDKPRSAGPRKPWMQPHVADVDMRALAALLQPVTLRNVFTAFEQLGFYPIPDLVDPPEPKEVRRRYEGLHPVRREEMAVGYRHIRLFYAARATVIKAAKSGAIGVRTPASDEGAGPPRNQPARHSPGPVGGANPARLRLVAATRTKPT